MVHASSEDAAQRAVRSVRNAYDITETKPRARKTILRRVTAEA